MSILFSNTCVVCGEYFQAPFTSSYCNTHRLMATQAMKREIERQRSRDKALAKAAWDAAITAINTAGAPVDFEAWFSLIKK